MLEKEDASFTNELDLEKLRVDAEVLWMDALHTGLTVIRLSTELEDMAPGFFGTDLKKVSANTVAFTIAAKDVHEAILNKVHK